MTNRFTTVAAAAPTPTRREAAVIDFAVKGAGDDRRVGHGTLELLWGCQCVALMSWPRSKEIVRGIECVTASDRRRGPHAAGIRLERELARRIRLAEQVEAATDAANKICENGVNR